MKGWFAQLFQRIVESFSPQPKLVARFPGGYQAEVKQEILDKQFRTLFTLDELVQVQVFFDRSISSDRMTVYEAAVLNERTLRVVGIPDEVIGLLDRKLREVGLAFGVTVTEEWG